MPRYDGEGRRETYFWHEVSPIATIGSASHKASNPRTSIARIDESRLLVVEGRLWKRSKEGSELFILHFLGRLSAFTFT
jgi:hypothetical protein